ncbi:pyruvate kinase [Lutibacter sp. TH_r2]|uniref:pyruvate kinase n=1 Tax=Lutibacter sp. TH_r2 TaxID=3082083 RepID=UPI002955A222|nr:pyruvate kinase [Lutibacter sp. TH_r2]MDV7187871.1 pyruvate kinase [Lutibacter sp. TH_r2]
MLFPKNKLEEINKDLDAILIRINEYEKKYNHLVEKVHPKYTKSAQNLIHYLALRSSNVDILQKKLDTIGLPSSSDSTISVLNELLNTKTLIKSLLDIEKPKVEGLFLSRKQAKKLLKNNSIALFGLKKNNRKTSIMVTQPTLAAENSEFANTLLDLGMNCARVNCAHDDETVWKKIISNIKNKDPKCKITMDLGGPKLRTGKMKPGHKVIHIKPKRNTLGQVIAPAKIWLAPFGTIPPEGEEVDAIIPVNKKWLTKTKEGSYVIFRDSRDKKCRFNIEKIEGNGRWATCNDSAFVTTGALLNVFIEEEATSEIHSVHEILPLEEVIFLYEGDFLRLDKEPILGEPATYNENGTIKQIAHVSCTLPQIFKNVNIGEPIYFDDGKIEGIISEINPAHLLIKITSTKKKGGKLKADKGINLPNSKLKISGLTDKDKQDLKFVAKYADTVNFSFVNNKHDVEDLLNELEQLDASIGIILKIETQKAFENLPSILLKAMQNYPVGVMIARGDLAIETGWKNFAIIQEEILQLCEAAHLPDIWATQVLENLAKKGIPTRAEITDAAMAQRAECVMLNKGPYIEKAVKMLDKILRRMEKIQKKKRTILPKLKFTNNL